MEKIENNEQEKTVRALLAKIKELEEENSKLRQALIYNWLEGNK